MGITLAEYNRRWDLIMKAFQHKHFTAREASAAIAELTATTVRR